MKKSILAVLPLLFFSLAAFGQLEKGSVLLGGGIGFNSSTTTTDGPYSLDETNNSSFNFGLDAGYFFKDNWVIGLGLPLSWQSMKTDFGANSSNDAAFTEYNSSSVGLSPFARKYFSVGEKLSFFAQANLGYSHSSTEIIRDPSINDPITTLESNKYNVVASIGLSYFPKDWLGVNLAICPLTYTYHANNVLNETKYEVKGHTLDFGINTEAISLGVNFFLPKK